MNTSIKILLVTMIGIVLTMGIGCTTAKKAWISSPGIQSSGNPYYTARLEPLTKDHKFFVSFRLMVSNKTGKSLAVDWNKTRYIHNGRTRGVFVFQGISPDDIKNSTIPSDIIPAGERFAKVISPYKLLARGPISDRSKGITAPNMYPGIMPNGENGILLVVRQNGKEISEKMTLNIEEK